MNSLLKRQLERLGLNPDTPPDAAGWKLMLEGVERSYVQASQNRELVERSMALSSAEMRALNDELHKVNAELEERVAARTADLRVAQEKTERSLHFSKVLHALRDIDSSDTFDFFRAATRALSRALDVARASIWRVDAEAAAIVCLDLFDGVSAEHQKGARLLATDFPRYFQALGQLEVVDAWDARADARTSEFTASYLEPLGIRSMLDVPLKLGGKLQGVICIEHTGPVRHWAAEESEFARGVANVVANVLAEHARREAESAMAKSVARFQTLNMLSSDWYWEQDADLRISYLSDNYRQRSGTTPEAVLGKQRWDEPNRHPLVGTWEDHRAVLEARQPFRNFETVRLGADGARHYISLSGDPVFGEHGEFRGYQGVSSNITQRKRDELALQDALEAAQAANRAQSEFLANMSHEIRTPMNAVLGFTEILLRKITDAGHRDHLEKIQGAAVSLLRIINDILDLSKVEAGKLEIERIDLDLYRLLNDVSTIAAVQAQEKRLDFELRADAGLPERMWGDPIRISQILSNLCSNAIKFTAQGKITLSVRRKKADDAEATLEFAVSDTGIGLSAEQRAKLFQPFVQADSSTTRKFGGTGLGLSIAHQLAELMGGRITVQSELGEGSTFTFAMPCRDMMPAAPLPASRAAGVAGKRVLVIDDDEEFLDMARVRLAAWQMEVATAGSAREGIELLAARAATPNPFELLLIDWDMPSMDGINACKVIRADSRITTPPRMLLVTAHRNAEIEKEARLAGIHALMHKPLSASVLLNGMVKACQGGSVDNPAEVTELLRGVRVLLVEDHPVNQVVACAMLEKLGASTTVVNNGREALATLAPDRFEVVLMDMHMPEMDGIEATRRIRSNASLQTLPIIAMTASAMMEDRDLMLKAGMNDYISKPVAFDTLSATVAKWTLRGTPAATSQIPAN